MWPEIKKLWNQALDFSLQLKVVNLHVPGQTWK